MLYTETRSIRLELLRYSNRNVVFLMDKGVATIPRSRDLKMV